MIIWFFCKMERPNQYRYFAVGATSNQHEVRVWHSVGLDVSHRINRT